MQFINKGHFPLDWIGKPSIYQEPSLQKVFIRADSKITRDAIKEPRPSAPGSHGSFPNNKQKHVVIIM